MWGQGRGHKVNVKHADQRFVMQSAKPQLTACSILPV